LTTLEIVMTDTSEWRKTTQRVPPAIVKDRTAGAYDIYPAFSLAAGQIKRGVESLASEIAAHRLVVIDGFGGVLWERFRSNLDTAITALGVNAAWIDVKQAQKPSAEIHTLVEPYLGGNDPIFGTRCREDLIFLFDEEKLGNVRDSADGSSAPLTIIYGCGAALAKPADAFLVYVDVPKDEIQFRSRSGSITNLGADAPADAKSIYKRFYFVDWPLLNAHKQRILPDVSLFVDEQRPDDLTFIGGDDLRQGLSEMSTSCFRVRPWFEPGPWGGHWIEEHVSQLPKDVPNYAWSFELIVPENGIVFESDGIRIEVSFDCLMFAETRNVLGGWAESFGTEFPIRFDWLDTIGGGNLSVQCHPRPDYIRKHFGETFTQDETYYIMDAKPGANVYLGFNEGVDPTEFRSELERSYHDAVPIDIERFVAKWPAKKHDLFLIPNGTIHCSGTDNMVLEISATPYIFTFKMYDWLRLDLEGKPRPINIDRAFDNLYFDRQGKRVSDEFISHPEVIAAGADWQIVHMPTHPEHFYDIHRLEFASEISVSTEGSPQVMAVVEGGPVRVITENGHAQDYQYGETFVVPAASKSFYLINHMADPAKVVKAFIRSGHK